VQALAHLRQLRGFVLIISITTLSFSQSTKVPAPEREAAADQTLERAALISELQSLERETLKFNDPLAEALAKVEIADAAWQLDQGWAKKLIRAAYELTLPKTDEQSEQNRPAGSPPLPPNAADRSRWKVRFRALEVARRDKEFVNELTQMGKESLGAYGKHFASAALADQALEAGDVNASADYVLQGIKADPTQGTAPDIINRIATRDRALADHLVIQYISELRRFPISPQNQSDIRSFLILSSLMRPYLIYDPSIKVPAPGPEVMKAYIGYMLETLNNMEQQEPGYLVRRRITLLSLWAPLQQYAPEMASAFLNLESLSRNPGDKLSLPTTASIDEEKRLQYERNVKKELDGGQPQEATILSAIGRRDFYKARKMIDKLPDGAKKRYLTDTVNAEEASDLIKKGDIYEAERFAKELARAASISTVYPALISKCAAKKDQVCANRLVYQALKQIKDSDTSPPPVPEGIPASAVAGDPRFDPVLSFIAELAINIFPASDELAFNVLDELVSSANTTPIETEQARIGFDVSVFKKLAPKNETHVEQAAYSLRNPVQRVLALASIYQWKAKELTERQSKPAKVG
jgi:hypothetical protein